MKQSQAQFFRINVSVVCLCVCHICSVCVGLPAASQDISLRLVISGPPHLHIEYWCGLILTYQLQ